MKLEQFFICLTTILFIFLKGMAIADEEAPSDTFELEEIRVTASPIIEGNEVNNYGSQVTVVTEEQISNLNAQDLPSALRRTPGVIISRHNLVGSFGGGEGGAVFIRGQGSSRPGAEIQMLVDGIPKFVSVWTHPLMDVLSIDNVDRIEVYKGAQPVLFGNMALGAVNLHTKRMLKEGFTTSMEGAYGSYDTKVETFEHGGKVDKFDYFFVQSYRRSVGHRSDSDGELQNYFGRAGYEFSPHWDCSLTFNHTDNWADDPGRRDGSLPPDGRFNTKDYFTVATIANQYAWGEGYVKSYYEDGDIDWVDQEDTPGLDTLTDYDNYGVRAREMLWPWKGAELLLGLDIDYIRGKVDLLDPVNGDQYFPRETFRLIAPHVAVSQLIGSRDSFYIIPSAGFRYLNHNEFDEKVAPQAGLVIGFRDTEFHTFYSRGINYPGVYVKVQNDLFLPGENLWEDLDSEELDHFEAGISQAFTNKAVIDFTFFYDDGKDRIVVSPPPPFPPILTNFGDWTTKGVEGTLTLWPSPDVSCFLGFTYLNASPSDLPYTPDWTTSAGVNYRFLDNFHISLDTLYVDNQFVTSRARQEGTVNVDKVGSYFLLNAKVGYDFVTKYRNLKCQVFIAGENLTDEDYEQKKGYPMPGICGMVGLKMKY